MRSANFTCKSTKLSIGIEHTELNIWQNYKKNMRYQVYGRYTSEIYGQRVEESADHLTRSTPARKPLLDPVRSSLFRDTMDRGTEAGCDTAEGRRNTVFCVTNCALSPRWWHSAGHAYSSDLSLLGLLKFSSQWTSADRTTGAAPSEDLLPSWSRRDESHGSSYKWIRIEQQFISTYYAVYRRNWRNFSARK